MIDQRSIGEDVLAEAVLPANRYFSFVVNFCSPHGEREGERGVVLNLVPQTHDRYHRCCSVSAFCNGRRLLFGCLLTNGCLVFGCFNAVS